MLIEVGTMNQGFLEESFILHPDTQALLKIRDIEHKKTRDHTFNDNSLETAPLRPQPKKITRTD